MPWSRGSRTSSPMGRGIGRNHPYDCAGNARDPRRGDGEALLPLMEAYWRYDGIDGCDHERLRRQLQEFLSAPGLGRGWVAECRDALVGYLLVTFVYSFEHGGLMNEVDEFFVDEASRGQGTGRRFLETAGSELIAHPCVALQLQVAEENHPAQRCYRRLGFEPKSGYQVWALSLAGP